MQVSQSGTEQNLYKSISVLSRYRSSNMQFMKRVEIQLKTAGMKVEF